LIFFGGGVPLKSGGTVIGAVGVSGGAVDEDVQVANAAAAALT
jgi:cob(I)alamin adenosyltransferase